MCSIKLTIICATPPKTPSPLETPPPHICYNTRGHHITIRIPHYADPYPIGRPFRSLIVLLFNTLGHLGLCLFRFWLARHRFIDEGMRACFVPKILYIACFLNLLFAVTLNLSSRHTSLIPICGLGSFNPVSLRHKSFGQNLQSKDTKFLGKNPSAHSEVF